MGRWGDGAMGRWGDGAMRRWVGRWMGPNGGPMAQQRPPSWVSGNSPLGQWPSREDRASGPEGIDRRFIQ